ncbi:hypothetical protein [Spiroplasma endosymbiont of Seladonia tumulorum]
MIEKLRNNDWKIVSRKIINDQLQEYYHNNISFQPSKKRFQLIIRWMMFLGPFLVLWEFLLLFYLS